MSNANDILNLVKIIVSDQEKLGTDLLKYLLNTEKSIPGLNKIKETLDSNDNEANTRKQLKVALAHIVAQEQLNQKLISVLLMLIATRDFKGGKLILL